jgi:hypothetical protein
VFSQRVLFSFIAVGTRIQIYLLSGVVGNCIRSVQIAVDYVFTVPRSANQFITFQKKSPYIMCVSDRCMKRIH